MSDSIYFTKAQPEPIKAMVMKRRAPFSLGEQGASEVKWGPGPRLPHLCAEPADSQVRDIVHDREAFDGVALAVDEVVVDLEAGRCASSQRG